MEPKDRIICALDVDSEAKAVSLVTQLRGQVGVFKAGLELVTAAGLTVFDSLREAGAERIFYDAKLHDIPNTVMGAMRGVVKTGVWCVTVHAAGGAAMLRSAVDAARETGGNTPPKILAVTVLTSMSERVLHEELRVGMPITEYAAHLARIAFASGCDGVIASPHEIETVRQAVPHPDFLIVTPGVRPAGAALGDQARAMSPGEAIRRGADYLVIGRPITAAPDPLAAVQAIAAEIAEAGN